MIETINIGEREIDLCINAESQTLPEDRRTWLYVNKQLTTVKKKYYLESEGFIFLDEGKAISIAAQIVKWIHTDIRSGRHYIFLPFDNIVYMGTIRVQEDYILVEKEDLLPFEDCVQLIRNNPLECQVAELGKLSNAFKQHNIALKDLYINLEPGKNNPYLLKRGYNMVELSLVTMVPFIGVGLIFMLSLTINVKDLEEATIKPLPAKPKSTIQIDKDLGAVAKLLTDFSVLLVYNLDNIHIKKTAKGYNTSATGRYDQSFSLARLNRIARELEGRFFLQKNSWTLNSSLFKPALGETVELVPLPVSFENYRQFAISSHARFSVIGTSQKRDAAQGLIELAFDYPNSSVLQQSVQRLQQMALHGYIKNIDINTQKNAGWKNLTIIIEIIGT